MPRVCPRHNLAVTSRCQNPRFRKCSQVRKLQQPDDPQVGGVFPCRLTEAIKKCFPSFSNLVDWNCEPQWLDKEISQIIGRFGHRNREVDLLFKARLLDGRDQWILCHLEIQTQFEADFSFRIDLYNAGLKWMFQQEVATLVILADLRPDWRPNAHRFELADFRSIRELKLETSQNLGEDLLDFKSLDDLRIWLKRQID